VTNNGFWIGWLDLLVLFYNYTQLQPLITAHNWWLPKARSVSFQDYKRLLFHCGWLINFLAADQFTLFHCGWLVNFLAADQFTLSLTGSLSDLSLIHLANCSPFITFCELHTEHLTPMVPVSCICGNCLFMYALSQERAYRHVFMEIHVMICCHKNVLGEAIGWQWMFALTSLFRLSDVMAQYVALLKKTKFISHKVLSELLHVYHVLRDFVCNSKNWQ
jgi:hypothetical protein